MRIGLVDDKAVNRASIADKIKQFEDLDFCFTAVNGNDCLEQLKGLPYEKMPQVVFMDLEMPELDGVQTINIARAMYPEIYFIVLTVFDDDDKIFEAIICGVFLSFSKKLNCCSTTKSTGFSKPIISSISFFLLVSHLFVDFQCTA